MSKVWPVYDGTEPTSDGPWADLPVSEAIKLLELRRDDFVSDLSKAPRFGATNRNLWFSGYKHIVVEISGNEAKKVNWKGGFYRSRVKPEETFRRLIEQAIKTELGHGKVVRVMYEPAVDSWGQDALRITVVLKPRAIQQIAEDAPLNALVRLRERLNEMREERTPIVQYATEAELTQDAGA